MTHEIEPSLQEKIRPARYTRYFELLNDFYERHPQPVADMAAFFSALWSHTLFAPVFCLLFVKWLLSSLLQETVSPTPPTAPPDARAPQNTRVGFASPPGKSRYALVGDVSASPAHPGAPHAPPAAHGDGTLLTHAGGVSGSHYVALAAGAGRVFSFDVHNHSSIFVSVYSVLQRCGLMLAWVVARCWVLGGGWWTVSCLTGSAA